MKSRTQARKAKPAAEPSVDTGAWWKEILAGEVAARHPVHGDELKVKLTDGKLVLSGTVPTRRDRDALVREARERVGNGLHELDASRLKIRPHDEKPGVLSQALLASFDHPDTAQLARTFLLEHSRSRPQKVHIIDKPDALGVVPAELVEDARKQVERGRTLLLVEVDETEAFRVRSLLEEDTRSTWTVAAPPHVMSNGAK